LLYISFILIYFKKGVSSIDYLKSEPNTFENLKENLCMNKETSISDETNYPNMQSKSKNLNQI